jgi:hypothetical protein
MPIPSRPLVAALIAAAALAALPAPAARADAEAWTVSPGLLWRTADDGRVGGWHAVGLGVGAHYGLDDFWQLGGTIEAAWMPVRGDTAEDPTGLLGLARLDVRWLVDVLTWVPFVEASVGAVFRGRNAPADLGASPASPRLDLLVMGSLGLDYRETRDFSVGLRVGVGGLLTDLDRAGPLTRVDLVLNFHLD